MRKPISLLIALTAIVSSLFTSEVTTRTEAEARRIVYAPLVFFSESVEDDLGNEADIWHSRSTTGEHDVALLRHTFELSQSLETTQLRIFADTRYELWLDGMFIGRGPARFSRARREFDVYDVGALVPGRHVVAALVQWAPNLRRSESQRPEMRMHIEGHGPDGRKRLVARSSTAWRALASNAWAYGSRQIHLGRLIGPSEIVDLRRLPANWQAPDFDDSGWPTAIVLPRLATETRYSHRSIPFLSHTLLRPTLFSGGRVSPHATLLQPNADAITDAVTFDIANTQPIVIDAFGSDYGAAPPTATLNGAPLAWNADPQRPGVYTSSLVLTAGLHRIDGLIDRAALVHAPFHDVVAAAPAAAASPAPGVRVALAQPDADVSLIDASSPHTYRLPGVASYVLFDLGQVRHGRLIFDAAGPAGALLDVGWDERLQRGADWILPHPGPFHPEWSQVDSWTLDDTTRSVRTIDARTGRYVVVVAWGGPVTLADVRFEEERYPTTQIGSFTADPQLDEIWQTGVNTARINMLDSYADPWRERAQWWGDAFIVDRVNEVAFGDATLLRRGLQSFADGIVDGKPPAFAPNNDGTLLLDYGMLWIQSMDSYLTRTADESTVQHMYPKMQDLLRFLTRYRAAGSPLLDVPDAPWSESALVDFAAYYADVGAGGSGLAGSSTPVNAMYLGSLRAAARIAAQLGRTDDAARWDADAVRVRDAIHETLYDAATGCYSSTMYEGVRGRPTVHAQGWALAYDVPPIELRSVVADCLLAHVQEDPREPGFGPYGAYWILEGLANADRTADGIALIRRIYGAMLDRGATTWWEAFTADDSYAHSLSHGWGSAPTWFLSTHVLGVRQIGDALHVQPRITDLPAAAGDVPIMSSVVHVEWQRTSCRHTMLTIRAPATSRIKLPTEVVIMARSASSEGFAVITASWTHPCL